MRALAIAFIAVAGCSSPASYGGTWSGDFAIFLTPSPLGGNPSGTGTATLVESGSSVSGRFDVTIRPPAGTQTSMSSGSIGGSVDGSDKIENLTMTVDMLSPSCTPPQFTAMGTAYLLYDSSVGAERFSFNVTGTSTCGGTATTVQLITPVGLKKQ